MQKKKNDSLATIFVIICSILVFNSCSDDELKQQATKTHKPWGHSHDKAVTDQQKHVFEHDFAEQCVNREVSKSINKENAKKRFSKPCMCIATFMMQDLTAVEAEKFLQQNKSTQSLRIRFENAAYHCLQNKQRAQSPQLFKR